MLKQTILLSIIFASLYGEDFQDLKPMHPDEPTKYTYNERFSMKNSLESTQNIESALESFTKLTKATKRKISKRKLDKIGNTEWDIQNLGFFNWIVAIRGTLYKQEFLIKKLQYEQLLERSKHEEIENQKIINAKKDLEIAKNRFLKYWNSTTIAD